MNDSKYKSDFLEIASKLDKQLELNGEIVEFATAVIDNKDRNSIITLINKIAFVVESDLYSIDAKKTSKQLKDSLIKYLGYIHMLDICGSQSDEQDSRSLSELLNELNELVG